MPIVCSTDAHSTRGLGNMQLAVATARRGGATAADVLNTLPLVAACRYDARRVLPGPLVDHSASSNQCVWRRASTTPGSVCAA